MDSVEGLCSHIVSSSFSQAKAMYSCKAEHSHELSFPQGAIFSNGKHPTPLAEVHRHREAEQVVCSAESPKWKPGYSGSSPGPAPRACTNEHIRFLWTPVPPLRMRETEQGREREREIDYVIANDRHFQLQRCSDSILTIGVAACNPLCIFTHLHL